MSHKENLWAANTLFDSMNNKSTGKVTSYTCNINFFFCRYPNMYKQLFFVCLVVLAVAIAVQGQGRP